jgi:lysophospholipase L1-like esterase
MATLQPIPCRFHALIFSEKFLMPQRIISLSVAIFLAVCCCERAFTQSSNAPTTYDLVVYGGTSGGVMAAVQAKRMGLSVVLISPDKHLGGLSSGGLGWTDSGNKAVIGGLARDFYHRIWSHYQKPEAWKWQSRDEYGNQGQGTPAIDGEQRTMWIFEPHVAEQVFDELVTEYDILVYRDEWLDREMGVNKRDGKIASIRTLNGLDFQGRIFIDATYEGDLMAAAGVEYHVGRESREQYGEDWNGVQTGVLHHKHHFGAVSVPISPYVVPGDPSSGLVPHVSPDPPGEYGAADHRVQAYCFRMCLTDDPRNRIPFPKPDGYDPKQYELLARVLEAGWRETFEKFDPIPNHKTDTNNHGPFSTDFLGASYDYPEATYERRKEIIAEHERYQQGLMYFLANEPRVPEDVRSRVAQWGLAADEFQDNQNWPHQIYVREARRMVGSYIMTENELLKKRPTPDSIGMGSYTMDSHNVQRYVKPDGYVQNEGDIGVSTRGPYAIALGSILPKKEQCTNLIVPVCLSSSHIAFGSIRMEPVFMILGQSATTTAALALKKDIALQDVRYDELREQLLTDGQVLEYAEEPPAGKGSVNAKSLSGTVVDNSQAELVGSWGNGSSAGSYVGYEYLHDDQAGDGRSTAAFTLKLPPGKYEVRLSYAHHSNRATNVPVSVRHANGETTIEINQRLEPGLDQLFVSLGEFEFTADKAAVVTVSNQEADGYVIVDAVQFLPLAENHSTALAKPESPLAAIEDIPGLPRVLLIGDSISIGYTLEVRRLLAGRANVHRPNANCSSTSHGLVQLEKWLGEPSKKWDVIHFNFGLHDAKLPPEGVRHATPEAYEQNLRQLVLRLKATGAKLIWGSTTPVPNGGNLAPNRRFGDIDQYNAIAASVMHELGVAVNELDQEIGPHVDRLRNPNDVHYQSEGYAILARAVANRVTEQLQDSR